MDEAFEIEAPGAPPGARRADYFQILKVGQTPARSNGKLPIIASRAPTHPDRFLQLENHELRDAIGKIYKRINEAYVCLRDDSKRTKYLADVLSPRPGRRSCASSRPARQEMKKGEEAGGGTTPQGRKFFMAGLSDLAAQRFASAERNFTMALTYEPANVNFKAKRDEAAKAGQDRHERAVNFASVLRRPGRALLALWGLWRGMVRRSSAWSASSAASGWRGSRPALRRRLRQGPGGARGSRHGGHGHRHLHRGRSGGEDRGSLLGHLFKGGFTGAVDRGRRAGRGLSPSGILVAWAVASVVALLLPHLRSGRARHAGRATRPATFPCHCSRDRYESHHRAAKGRDSPPRNALGYPSMPTPKDKQRPLDDDRKKPSLPFDPLGDTDESNAIPANHPGLIDETTKRRWPCLPSRRRAPLAAAQVASNRRPASFGMPRGFARFTRRNHRR